MADPLPPVSLFSSEEEVTFDPLDPTLLKILQDVMGDTGVLEEFLREDDLGSIQDVLSLTLEQIDQLTMPASRMKTWSGPKDPDLPWETLSLGKQGILKAFKGYVWWYHINHGYPPAFGFIQKTDFDDFRISLHWNPEALFDTSLPGLSGSSYKRDPAEDFKRGIKRDLNHYSVYKEDKQWGSCGKDPQYLQLVLMDVNRSSNLSIVRPPKMTRHSSMRSRNSCTLFLRQP